MCALYCACGLVLPCFLCSIGDVSCSGCVCAQSWRQVLCISCSLPPVSLGLGSYSLFHRYQHMFMPSSKLPCLCVALPLFLTSHLIWSFSFSDGICWLSLWLCLSSNFSSLCCRAVPLSLLLSLMTCLAIPLTSLVVVQAWSLFAHKPVKVFAVSSFPWTYLSVAQTPVYSGEKIHHLVPFYNTQQYIK